MSFSGKSITRKDYDVLIGDSSRDLAIPELKFKFDLFMDLNDFKKSWNEYQRVYFQNKSNEFVPGKHGAIADLLRVFNDIKFMVSQKRAWNINYRDCRIEGKLISSEDYKRHFGKSMSNFEEVCSLDRGADFPYQRLLVLKDYVLWCLHVCNLTNLLRADTREDVIGQFREDLGV